MNRDYWVRQNPAIAEEKWLAQAYLGQLEYLSTLDGLGFQIIAILIKQSLSKTLPETVHSLEDLIKLKGVHIISKIRTAVIRKID